ncbi:MAG TPA: DUF5677 domain-containing protein [Polyangiaceae bacterium]|nr:DUF5677 domain-containing protein [Polyangiaceae bacterium]
MSGDSHEDSLNLLKACSLNCKQLAVFVGQSVRPILDRELNALPYRRICHALFLRVQAWLNSLSKLDEPGDFQAASAAARGIFETAIDMVLIQHQEGQSVIKLMAWERSCKLKYAERHSAHSNELHVIEFVRDNKRAILSERESTWGKNKNGKPIAPERWTGRNLEQDAKAADAYVPKASFVRFYSESYVPACWYVHGSGVVGILEVPAAFFPTLSALALHKVCVFGLVCTEYALRLFNVFDEIGQSRFARLQSEMGTLALAVSSRGLAKP